MRKVRPRTRRTHTRSACGPCMLPRRSCRAGWHVRRKVPVRVRSAERTASPISLLVRGTAKTYQETPSRSDGNRPRSSRSRIRALADDRALAVTYGAAGHPGLLDRQPTRSPGRSLHRPRCAARPGIALAWTTSLGQDVPVVIDGTGGRSDRCRGSVAVNARRCGIDGGPYR